MVKIVQRSPLWSISSLIGYLATGKLRQRSSDDLCMSQPSIKSISSQVQWKKPSFLWAISKVITQTIRALWHCIRVASHQFISFPLDTHTAIRRSQKGFHSLLLQPRWCSRRTDTWWHDSSGHVASGSVQYNDASAPTKAEWTIFSLLYRQSTSTHSALEGLEMKLSAHSWCGTTRRRCGTAHSPPTFKYTALWFIAAQPHRFLFYHQTWGDSLHLCLLSDGRMEEAGESNRLSTDLILFEPNWH